MGKINIIKSNQMIAEFMGYEKVSVGYVGGDDETEWQIKNREWMDSNGMDNVGDYIVNVLENKWHECNDIAYHSSWDWLMSVVAKCHEKTTMGIAMHYKIEEQYAVVVSFIKSLKERRE